MPKTPSKRNAIPPSFSVLNAMQDGVLVCTKKDGTVEEFKYVPLADVRIGDVTLGEFLQNVRTYQTDEINYIKTLEEKIDKLDVRQRKFANIFKGDANQ